MRLLRGVLPNREPGPPCESCRKPTILLDRGRQRYCWDCDGVLPHNAFGWVTGPRPKTEPGLWARFLDALG